MNLQKLIYGLGDNVFQKRARVEKIERVTDPDNIAMSVRILDPSICPVDRIDTWLVKMNDDEVHLILMPTRFRILLTEDFYLKDAHSFPPIERNKMLQVVLDNVKVGDELVVLHVSPALHAGEYCTFEAVD